MKNLAQKSNSEANPAPAPTKDIIKNLLFLLTSPFSFWIATYRDLGRDRNPPVSRSNNAGK